jgi:hypothetical protein
MDTVQALILELYISLSLIRILYLFIITLLNFVTFIIFLIRANKQSTRSVYNKNLSQE